MHLMPSDWLTPVLRGQEPSGFCFSHFFNYKCERTNHLFSCCERFYDWKDKKNPKNLGSTYLSGLTPSTIFRSLLEQMEGIFFLKKKPFLGSFTRLDWQEKSDICRSRGQRSDTSQLKFHYTANWVKGQIQPRIVKAFLLKELGHLGPDLSIQFRPWHTSVMRQYDSSPCPSCPLHVHVCCYACNYSLVLRFHTHRK